MKYELKIRKINESDLNVGCLSIPEEEDFGIQVNALKEDIQALNVVVSIDLILDYFLIEVSSEEDLQILHSSVRDLLNQYNDKLKTVNGFQVVK
ncbi:MAG: hypothetical protein DRI32_09715 [Chloroflexi bacterium]|nr:MAG: hypothetical protein DRI32_09715 [Chloroflexota bacterium]